MIKLDPATLASQVVTIVSAEESFPCELEALLNEHGQVDFNQVVSLEAASNLPRISPRVLMILSPLPDETLREICQFADAYKSSAILAIANAIGSTLLDELSDKEKTQFLTLLSNYKKTGYLTYTQYAESEWGTSENALQSGYAKYAGKLTFITKDASPIALLKTLSKKFPSRLLTVQYSTAVAGLQCGELTLQRGEILSSRIAPAPAERTQDEVAAWLMFSRNLFVEHFFTNEGDDEERFDEECEEDECEGCSECCENCL